jgi:hypothetical protein
MKFVTIISSLVTITSVLAIEPGKDSIGAGLSDEFEKALYNEGNIEFTRSILRYSHLRFLSSWTHPLRRIVQQKGCWIGELLERMSFDL